MPPNQFLGNFAGHFLDVESSAFICDLGVHYHQQQEIAEFFTKMRVVLCPSSFGYLVGLFDGRRQE